MKIILFVFGMIIFFSLGASLHILWHQEFEPTAEYHMLKESYLKDYMQCEEIVLGLKKLQKCSDREVICSCQKHSG